jgi:hypothetical protein
MPEARGEAALNDRTRTHMPMSGYRQTWHHRPVRDADFSGVGADMESQ